MIEAHLKASKVLYFWSVELQACLVDEVDTERHQQLLFLQKQTRNAIICVTIVCPHPVSRSCFPS